MLLTHAIDQDRAVARRERFIAGLLPEQYAPPIPFDIVSAREDLRSAEDAIAALPDRTHRIVLLNWGSRNGPSRSRWPVPWGTRRSRDPCRSDLWTSQVDLDGAVGPGGSENSRRITGRLRIKGVWLGRQDSNLGMAVPKTAALPLGDAPSAPRRRFSRRAGRGWQPGWWSAWRRAMGRGGKPGLMPKRSRGPALGLRIG